MSDLLINGSIGLGESKKLIYDENDGLIKVSSTANLSNVIGFAYQSKGAGAPTAVAYIKQ